jgi:hypothetical protein
MQRRAKDHRDVIEQRRYARQESSQRRQLRDRIEQQKGSNGHTE